MTYLEPCVVQEAAGCADLLKTQVREEVESEVDLREDAHQEAYPLVAFREATVHVQRGALGVSLEAD